MTPRRFHIVSSSRSGQARQCCFVFEVVQFKLIANCTAHVRGLTSEQANQVDGRRFHGEASSPDDIIALLKLNLCDDELCQAPTLVWPASAERSSREALATSDQHAGFRNSVDEERSQGLQALAGALAEYPQYGRACTYFLQVAGVRRRVLVGLHRLEFLAGARVQRRQIVPPGVLPDRVERRPAYRLQAVFHRGRG